jgi:hypothetical protein
MHHHLRRALLAIGLALCTAVVAVATASGASAVASRTVGLWNFNEGAGARVAFDSSGFNQRGTVGSDVRTGGGIYRFPSVSGVRTQHLVTVPSNTRLNPGSSEYAVTVRFRTTRSLSNVVQKGQAGQSGGFWKVEVSGGRAICLFRAGNGTQRAIGSSVRVNNGAFHTVRCERNAGSTRVIVDGAVRGSTAGFRSSISNPRPVSIGGKSNCGGSVTCDYFVGDIDYVRIQRG